MIEYDIPLSTSDGKMSTFVTHPERGGPFPAVLLYMDARGIREELRDFARRLAAVGYYCILPDLFHRWGERIAVPSSPLAMPNFPEMTQVLSLAKLMSRDAILAYTDVVLAHLDTDAAAAKGAMGCIGYCMGGRFVFWAMGARAGRFRAGASMFGTGLCTESAESPHRLAGNVEGEIYFAFGDEDPLTPQAEIADLQRCLSSARVTHEIEVHAGMTHGFAFPERTEVYGKAAAERTWERIFALLRRQLGPPADR